MASWRRTHTCGELRLSDVGRTVTINGWVQNYRDHGGLVFLDVRDRYGLTQAVFDPRVDASMHETARTLRSEAVVSVCGRVLDRGERRNPKLPTGDVEIQADSLVVLNRSEPPPFEIGAEDDPASEDVRLRYRYLDLRRPKMQRTLVLRHRIVQAMRDYLNSEGFLEIETPMLGRSTPEGARDFLVPSRMHPGQFYALPQSPQLLKQILMVAGYDKYYQLARCFRDEDLRANRQPEFTQMDVEMSFVDADDVMETMEGLAAAVVQAIRGETLPRPLKRLEYHEAMERYGVDKPDLRFGLELVDVTEVARESEFGVFRGAPCVRGLNVPGAAERYSRKDLDGLTAFAAEHGAKGLAWIKVEAGKWNSPIAKFFRPEQQARIQEQMGGAPGDLFLFVADQREATHAPLAALRNRLGKELSLYDPSSLCFCWVTKFPMFEWDAEEKRFIAMHHPFTSPLDEDWDLLETAPEKARAKAYDLVLNGEEAGGGTIRLHQFERQMKVFELIGLSREEQESRFGFLLEALRYGAPPHGGVAFGLDRWVMQFGGLESIRDGMAFPKTQRGQDLMMGAPGDVEPRQLRELGIEFTAETRTKQL
jgi:aspartyl-tRNA synthetase